MKKLLYILGVLIIALILGIVYYGCRNTVSPLGPVYDIHVVADSAIWQQSAPLLKEIFEKVEYNPQPEKVFQLFPADVNNYKRYKNIILLSTLDAKDKISENINTSLDGEIKRNIAAGNFIFFSKNKWTDPQIVIFLIAPDLTMLKKEIEDKRTEIFSQFDDYWSKAQEDYLFKYKEQVAVEKHLLNTYGWTIRVPADYKFEIQSAGDRFVMFSRQFPSRWLAIYWTDASDSSIITKDWCIAKRNEIGTKFYEKEFVEQKYQDVLSENTIFLNRHALYLKGLWKDDEKVAGGPFRLYCFFDKATERIYFIDIHVFAPERSLKKIRYLKQMDIIAKTFKTNLEIKPDQIS